MNMYVLLIAAFLLRLIGITQSLWLDEATTAKVVHSYSFSQIITTFSPTDFHPPLYYLFMKMWTSAFGLSEISLRLPSVLFSLLAGYMVYRIGKKLKNEKVGLWAALFFLFNPLIVYYSQEARMYLMATYFMMSALYFYLYIEQKKPKITYIFLCNLFIFLSFVTFYGSAFFISALYIYLLIRKKFKEFFYIHPGFLIPLLVLSPLLYRQLMNAKEATHIVVNWGQVLGKATLKNLFLIPLKFAIGRISFEPKIVYYLVSVPWTVFVWFNALRKGRTYELLVFILLFPLGLGLVFSFFSPLLQYFRFIYLVPILCLLLALSLKSNTVKYIIAAGFIAFSAVYVFLPQFHREDWKSLAQDLQASNVYSIPSSSDGLAYYKKNVHITPLFEIEKTKDTRVTVIPYTADIYGFDYQSILTEKHYILDKKTSYRGLTVEYYKK